MLKKPRINIPFLCLIGKSFFFASSAAIFFIIVAWNFSVYKYHLDQYSLEDRQYNASREELEKFKCEKIFTDRELFKVMFLLTAMLTFVPLFELIYFMVQFLSLKRKYILRVLNIDKSLVSKFSASRKDHLFLKISQLQKEVRFEVNELLSEDSFILKGLDHPNLILMQIPSHLFRTNLKDFMFGVFHPGISEMGSEKFPPTVFRVLVVFLKDILRAVQYLHDRHIYHLDLQPKNILVLETSETEVGRGVKIGGFTYAKQIENKKVSCQEVGLDKYKRPPEYFRGEGKHEIDADKFDSWSIGITAYELFTGGMLTVESELKLPEIDHYEELFSIANVMDQVYFASAMDSRWDMQGHLVSTANPFPMGRMKLDAEALNFTRHCYDFVQRLLKFEPRLRSSVAQALDATLVNPTWKVEAFWA